MTDWKLFHRNYCDRTAFTNIPDRPPWREFIPVAKVDEKTDNQYWETLQAKAEVDQRAIAQESSFEIQKEENGYSEVVDAVNAALHLRTPTWLGISLAV